MTSIIMHIDLDSFYASVEEVRNPELKGKPIIICMFSGRSADSGAVATASYAARAKGVKAAMPIRTAKKKLPDGVFLPADRPFYKEVSNRVMTLFREFADAFEQRSIDEAYLDVSTRCTTYSDAEKQARIIKERLLAQEQLTCSVGIGPNKLVAKMASRAQKPNGLTSIPPEDVDTFLREKPIQKLFGVGPKTLEVLSRYKIATVQDLRSLSLQQLQQEFGLAKGKELFDHARGEGSVEVKEVEAQQISRLITIAKDTRDIDEIRPVILRLSEDVVQTTEKRHAQFRTLSILVITNYHQAKSRSMTLPHIGTVHDLQAGAEQLLQTYLDEYPADVVRRFGVRVQLIQKEKNQRALSDFR